MATLKGTKRTFYVCQKGTKEERTFNCAPLFLFYCIGAFCVAWNWANDFYEQKTFVRQTKIVRRICPLTKKLGKIALQLLGEWRGEKFDPSFFKNSQMKRKRAQKTCTLKSCPQKLRAKFSKLKAHILWHW